MTLEKRTMLPGGVRYWQNFTSPAMKLTGRAWIETQTLLGNARLVTEEGDQSGSSDVFFVMWDVPAGRSMPWAQLELGFPTIANPQTAKTRNEIDAGPASSAPFDWSLFTGIAAVGAAPLFLFLGAVYLLGGSSKRRR